LASFDAKSSLIGFTLATKSFWAKPGRIEFSSAHTRSGARKRSSVWLVPVTELSAALAFWVRCQFGYEMIHPDLTTLGQPLKRSFQCCTKPT
jgi:hypothetical protein